mgnify:CR=1 FL=1
MKRLTLILMMLSFAVPTWALAELEIHMEQKEENGQSLTVFRQRNADGGKHACARCDAESGFADGERAD